AHVEGSLKWCSGRTGNAGGRAVMLRSPGSKGSQVLTSRGNQETQTGWRRGGCYGEPRSGTLERGDVHVFGDIVSEIRNKRRSKSAGTLKRTPKTITAGVPFGAVATASSSSAPFRNASWFSLGRGFTSAGRRYGTKARLAPQRGSRSVGAKAHS